MIVEEDRDILESTDPDATMDMSRKVESHMPSDRPGMIMRRRILQLLREHGEEEVSEAVSGRLRPGRPHADAARSARLIASLTESETAESEGRRVWRF